MTLNDPKNIYSKFFTFNIYNTFLLYIHPSISLDSRSLFSSGRIMVWMPSEGLFVKWRAVVQCRCFAPGSVTSNSKRLSVTDGPLWSVSQEIILLSFFFFFFLSLSASVCRNRLEMLQHFPLKASWPRLAQTDSRK